MTFESLLDQLDAWEYCYGVWTTHVDLPRGAVKYRYQVWITRISKDRVHILVIDPSGFKHSYCPKLDRVNAIIALWKIA